MPTGAWQRQPFVAVFKKNRAFNLTMRNIWKLQIEVFLQNTCPVIFRKVKVMNDKGNLRNYHKVDKIKEAGYVDIMWNIFVSGIEKNSCKKFSGIQVYL